MSNTLSQHATQSRLEGAFLLTLLENGRHQTSYWGAMGRDICRALADAGETCRTFWPDSPDGQETMQAIVMGDKPLGYALGFNLIPDLLGPAKESLWPVAKVPLIIGCLDHPTHIIEPLAGLLDASRLFPQLPPRYVGIMEEGHRTCLLDLGWPADQIFLFPQGGPPPTPAPLPYAERPPVVQFFGTVGAPTRHEDFIAQVGWVSPALQVALGDAVEETLDGSDDVYSVCTRIFQPFGLTLQGAGKITVIVDRRARLLRRFRMLENLNGLAIDVYGKAEAAAATRLPHCTFHGEVDFETQRALTRRARIALNDTLNFRHSALIRAFYAMAEGTVVATEINDFFETHFRPVNGILPLGPNKADNANLVTERLHDTDGLQAMADAAGACYAASHQWKARLSGLRNVLNRLRCREQSPPLLISQ